MQVDFSRLNQAVTDAWGETVVHRSLGGVETDLVVIWDSQEPTSETTTYIHAWFETSDLTITKGEVIIRNGKTHRVIDVLPDAGGGTTLVLQEFD